MSIQSILSTASLYKRDELFEKVDAVTEIAIPKLSIDLIRAMNSIEGFDEDSVLCVNNVLDRLFGSTRTLTTAECLAIKLSDIDPAVLKRTLYYFGIDSEELDGSDMTVHHLLLEIEGLHHEGLRDEKYFKAIIPILTSFVESRKCTDKQVSILKTYMEEMEGVLKHLETVSEVLAPIREFVDLAYLHGFSLQESMYESCLRPLFKVYASHRFEEINSRENEAVGSIFFSAWHMHMTSFEVRKVQGTYYFNIANLGDGVDYHKILNCEDGFGGEMSIKDLRVQSIATFSTQSPELALKTIERLSFFAFEEVIFSVYNADDRPGVCYQDILGKLKPESHPELPGRTPQLTGSCAFRSQYELLIYILQRSDETDFANDFQAFLRVISMKQEDLPPYLAAAIVKQDPRLPIEALKV